LNPRVLGPPGFRMATAIYAGPARLARRRGHGGASLGVWGVQQFRSTAELDARVGGRTNMITTYRELQQKNRTLLSFYSKRFLTFNYEPSKDACLPRFTPMFRVVGRTASGTLRHARRRVRARVWRYIAPFATEPYRAQAKSCPANTGESSQLMTVAMNYRYGLSELPSICSAKIAAPRPTSCQIGNRGHGG
jgi:hypothetical protein